MRWYEKSVMQTLVIFAVMLGVFVVQKSLADIFIAKDRTVIQATNELTTVAAGVGCPYDSGVSIPTGGTESDASNADVRWPISQHRHEYDVFGDNYFSLVPETDNSILTLTKDDGGAVDSKMNGFMASMFGFKPSRLAGAYRMRYQNAPRGGDSEIKGNAPVLEVAVDPANPTIKVPSTGYDIGSGNEAMVVFASSDRVTLHIGRHEYFTSSKTCKNGQTCSGGYWIYVKNICVDQKIVSAYNSVKSAQESAGADLNPIQLPMLRAGHILGKAQSNNKIIVGVRDNGPFISTFKSIYWGGVPGGDYNSGTNPTAVPTDIPEPVIPISRTPTPTPTPDPTENNGTARPTTIPSPTSTVYTTINQNDTEINVDNKDDGFEVTIMSPSTECGHNGEHVLSSITGKIHAYCLIFEYILSRDDSDKIITILRTKDNQGFEVPRTVVKKISKYEVVASITLEIPDLDIADFNGVDAIIIKMGGINYKILFAL
jgi:hypothetical protein